MQVGPNGFKSLAKNTVRIAESHIPAVLLLDWHSIDSRAEDRFAKRESVEEHRLIKWRSFAFSCSLSVHLLVSLSAPILFFLFPFLL